MRILLRMRFWTCEFLELCDFEHVNFWKKCGFCQNLLEHLDTSFQLKQQYQMPQRQLDILKSWGHLLTRTKPIAQALRKKTHIKWQFLQCWLLWAQEKIFHLNKLTPKSWFGVLSCQLKRRLKISLKCKHSFTNFSRFLVASKIRLFGIRNAI